MNPVVRSADARRAEIQAYAEKIGIDDAYISILVDSFYKRIRENPQIGPIFDEAIGDNWDLHLARMKDFWASVALYAGRYSGQPMPKHQRLSKAQAWHFDVWLALFEETLKETAPSPPVVDYFMERANRIAQSLKLGMFGATEILSKK